MHLSAKNIALIGMPGAGKSTIGPALAAKMGFEFVDTDTLIENRHGASLQEVLDMHGLDAFQKIEEQTLLELTGGGRVIATGGSVVYSQPAMEHLRKIAMVVWLQVELVEIEQRVNNQDCRGLVTRSGQGLADLFHERLPLYRRYAHHSVDCTGKTPEEIAAEITLAIYLNP